MLYKLFAGISDEELQKVLLTKAKLTLAEAKKMYSMRLVKASQR